MLAGKSTLNRLELSRVGEPTRYHAARRSSERAHCLVENVPEFSAVASHKLLPTEGYEQGQLWD
ncbi:hypothetical protein ABID25_006596, partial [Mesorhizobium abyssinicae]